MAQDLLGNGADSLEDDFVPDDLVALSGEEDEATFTAEGAAVDDLEEEQPAATSGDATKKKRKRREKEKERKAKVSLQTILQCFPVN